jgi:ribosome-associated translation inhibitor RaiA
MKYYRYLKEIEEETQETDTNYFITYTFGGNTFNRRSRSYGSGWYSYNDDCGYYSIDPFYKKYEFKVGWIYQSADDGITIVDDNNNVHDLDPIKDYFFEVNTDLDVETEKLIKLKREKGATITVKPLMMDLHSYRILYRVECSVMTTNGRCFSSTWDEDTDVYNSVVHCFKKLRTGTLSGYHHKIKEVLEKQKDERIRKHT